MDSEPTAASAAPLTGRAIGKSITAGILLGVGFGLRWICHAGGWLAMVVGLFLFLDLQRRKANVPRRLWAGALIGSSVFPSCSARPGRPQRHDERCLAAAILPAPGSMPGFLAQMVQHLVLAMLGPLLLALSAPITLALRTLPRAGRQMLLRALQSPVARILALAPVVLIMQVGGMYAYYLTPLYVTAHQQLWLHGLVHPHMFLAGCLLSWYHIGPDPMPEPGWVQTTTSSQQESCRAVAVRLQVVSPTALPTQDHRPARGRPAE